MFTMLTTRRCNNNVERASEVVEGFQNSDDGNLKMIARGFYIPKEDPNKPLGEDAYFICEEQQTMGVADGVGGWAKHGIDAGIYARELMYKARIAVEREPKGFVDPYRVLNEAFLNSKAQGSCTASIVTLTNHFLHGVNVGDSMLRLFRKYALFFESPIQQHRFNNPFQLGNSEKSDRPDSAEEYQVCVQPGDVIVFGSDGLWDNVRAGEIEEILCQKSLDGMDIQELMTYIAKFALGKSMQKDRATPFSVAAQREGYHHIGGKIDDITVLVAYIV